MFRYIQIISESTVAFLETQRKIEFEILEKLDKKASSREVFNLQRLSWEKSIFAVGIFSLFESSLQQHLELDDGYAFVKLIEILSEKEECELLEKFKVYQKAINVLKHGKGRSFNQLTSNSMVDFQIDNLDELNPDVADTELLVKVDEAFLLKSIEIIKDCFECIKEY